MDLDNIYLHFLFGYGVFSGKSLARFKGQKSQILAVAIIDLVLSPFETQAGSQNLQIFYDPTDAARVVVNVKGPERQRLLGGTFAYQLDTCQQKHTLLDKIE